MLKKILLSLALSLSLVTPVLAAPTKVTPSCTISGSPLVLRAINLPDNPLAITSDPYPTGVGIYAVNGTLTITLAASPPITIYIWQRGGGPSLIKAGAQLNDYHVIAICTAP
jgi:hypothetical protein